jgi:hypothetical protein
MTFNHGVTGSIPVWLTKKKLMKSRLPVKVGGFLLEIT